MVLRDRKACVITAALCSRFLYILHILWVIWLVYRGKGKEPYWWLLAMCLLLMIVELILVIVKNKGREWAGYVSASFFLYLATVLPGIWISEIQRIDNINQNSTQDIRYSFNFTGEELFQITLTEEGWSTVIKQVMMVLIIFTRWIMPAQHLTHMELSNMLLVYIGSAADILELLENFQSAEAVQNWEFVYATLAIWSLSLFQFAVVIPEEDDAEGENDDLPTDHVPLGCNCTWAKGKGELINIFISIFMMNLPFFVLRLLSITRYQVVSQIHIFFAIKNALVLVLSLYRIAALWCLNKDKTKEFLRSAVPNPVRWVSKKVRRSPSAASTRNIVEHKKQKSVDNSHDNFAFEIKDDLDTSTSA